MLVWHTGCYELGIVLDMLSENSAYYWSFLHFRGCAQFKKRKAYFLKIWDEFESLSFMSNSHLNSYTTVSVYIILCDKLNINKKNNKLHIYSKCKIKQNCLSLVYSISLNKWLL